MKLSMLLWERVVNLNSCFRFTYIFSFFLSQFASLYLSRCLLILATLFDLGAHNFHSLLP